MSQNAAGTEVIRFGPFALDEARRRLTRNGQPVALSGKPFDVLVALVEGRGGVVSRAELLERVWPGVIVEEANLTQAISVLRKALGEESGSSEYITTVPGRGYRFVAPVVPGGEDAPRALLQPRFSRPRIWVLLGAIAVTVVLAATWLGGRRSAQSTAAPTVTLDRGRTSVAVLPFYEREAGGLSAALGMDVTELVIGHLTRDTNFAVRPAQDVMEFRNPRRDTPATAGRQLEVDRVITGSLTQRDSSVRVLVQIVDSSDGATVATAAFEEPSGDPRTLAERIASKAFAQLDLSE
jgi:DNA-binding winged helix-turn-helix (wHTH) protein/TolB-like protein